MSPIWSLPQASKRTDRIARKEINMNLKQLFVAAPVALCVLGSGVANAGEPIKDTGAMACVNDKWDVKEPEKGHKLVDAAMRCVLIPDDPAEPTISQDCVGQLRIHARRELEGHRNLHGQLSGWQDYL